MRLVNGSLLLDGYDEDCRILKYESAFTKRLIKLRNAQHILFECRTLLNHVSSLEAVNKNGQHTSPMKEALTSSACTYYFSCFQTGRYAAKLDPRNVFQGYPDLLEQHKKWRRVRDNRFNHPEDVGVSFEAGLVLDKDNEILDVKVVRFDLPVSALSKPVEALRTLVLHTDSYVERAVSKLHERIMAEANGLSESQRLALKPMTVIRPDY